MSQWVTCVSRPTREHTIMLRFVGLCAAVLLLLSESRAVLPIGNWSEVCYADLGCFNNGPPFQSEQRPVSFLPEPPEKISPRFIQYSRENPTDGTLLHAGNVDGLNASFFQAGRPTKILVYGYVDTTFLGSWMQDATREFLKHGDYNVINVDWIRGSLTAYGQACANARVVGAMINQLFKFIQSVTGARIEDLHLIGHSLGAHVCGYAGERLSGLPRITGLDPAEPYFQYTDPIVRLDPSDAKFVDIIHTDDAGFYTQLGLGLKQPIGHVDFYVNGGHDQPGCERTNISPLLVDNLLQGVREYVGCNHARAYYYFVNSINSLCPFQAYRCNTYADFNQGKCIPCSGEGCGFMGMRADEVKPTSAPTTNHYYLKTGREAPFCRYHFKVQLTFAAPSGAQKERGLLYVTVTGSEGRTDEVKLTENITDIQPNNTYAFVITSEKELGVIQAVTVRWYAESLLLLPVLETRRHTLYVDKVEVYSGEAQRSTSLCGKGVAVETGQSVTISETC